MSVPVEVPALGESITEAIVAEWAKKEGEFVEEDEILVELETDKITVAVPAPVSGVLTTLRAATDDTVNVGDVLAEIEPGEKPAGASNGATSADPVSTLDSTSASSEAYESALSPAVRRLIDENAINPRDIKGSGPGGADPQRGCAPFPGEEGLQACTSRGEDANTEGTARPASGRGRR